MFGDLIRDALLGDPFALTVIFVCLAPFFLIGAYIYTAIKERK